MNQSEKARELYVKCDNTDPNENSLMPYQYEKLEGIYSKMAASILVNRYALKEYEQDWIPYAKETFYIGDKDNQGWEDLENVVSSMEKSEFLERKFIDGQVFIRWCDDGIYNVENYKSSSL